MTDSASGADDSSAPDGDEAPNGPLDSSEESPDAAPAGRRRRFIVWAKTSKWAFALWVFVLVAVAFPLVFKASAQLGPGTVETSLRPTWSGGTELALPPFGAIDAPTHRAPVHVKVELREVDVLSTLGTSGNPEQPGDVARIIEDEVRDDLGAAVRRIAAQLVLIAAACGLIAALCFPGRRTFGRVAAATIGSPLLVILFASPAAIGFDEQAFVESPTFTGQLASADELLSRVGSLETRFGSVQSRAKVLSERLAGLYSATLNDDIARSDGELTLLHVSDLHLNAVGLALGRDFAEQFGAQAVVDTGDFTSFGFAPEGEFLDQLAGFDIPYILVAGNHDSQEIRDQLAASDQIIYLDGESTEVDGLKISGIADPTQTALKRIPRDEIRRQYEAQFPLVERLVARERPDLLLVHHALAAKTVMGKVPVVAAGHIHKSRTEIVDGTVVAIVGTSGANGLGNLLVDEDAPYEFELLRFIDNTLVAIDNIKVNSNDGSFELSRKLIRPTDLDGSEENELSSTEDEGETPSLEDLSQGQIDQVTTTLPIPGATPASSSTTSVAGDGG